MLGNIQKNALSTFQHSAGGTGKGKDTEAYKKWYEHKAHSFAQKIFDDFSGVVDGVPHSKRKGLPYGHMIPMLARDADLMLQNNMKLPDAYTQSWKPDRGRVLGSMPGPEHIKSGLLHTLVNELYTRKGGQAAFLKTDAKTLQDHIKLSAVLGGIVGEHISAPGSIATKDVAQISATNRFQVRNLLTWFGRNPGFKVAGAYAALQAFAGEEDFETADVTGLPGQIQELMAEKTRLDILRVEQARLQRETAAKAAKRGAPRVHTSHGCSSPTGPSAGRQCGGRRSCCASCGPGRAPSSRATPAPRRRQRQGWSPRRRQSWSSAAGSSQESSSRTPARRRCAGATSPNARNSRSREAAIPDPGATPLPNGADSPRV